MIKGGQYLLALFTQFLVRRQYSHLESPHRFSVIYDDQSSEIQDFILKNRVRQAKIDQIDLAFQELFQSHSAR